MLTKIPLLTLLIFSVTYPLCFWLSARDPLKNKFHHFHIGLPNVTAGLCVVGMVLSIFAILRTGAATLAASVTEDERRTAAGLISGVVAFTVFAMSEPVLFSRFGWIPAALLLSLRMIQQRRAVSQAEVSPVPAPAGRHQVRVLPGLSS